MDAGAEATSFTVAVRVMTKVLPGKSKAVALWVR